MARGLRVRASFAARVAAPCSLLACLPLRARSPVSLPIGSKTSNAWKARRFERRDASLHPAQGVEGPALRLDFDLRGTAGYALASRALPLDLPANYEITFDLRGDAPINDFQVKLVDETGENVWWFRRQNFAFPREWRKVRIKKRQVDFAWGPTDGSHAASRGAASNSSWPRGAVVAPVRLMSATSRCANCRPSARHGVRRTVLASSFVAAAEPVSRGRRQHCDGVEERSRYRPRAIPHARLRRATGVRRPRAALATRHVRIAVRRAILGRRPRMANGAQRRDGTR